MKTKSLIILGVLAIVLLLNACRTRELCPAYQSKAESKTEKRS